ncbi:MAG: cyclase family protein [Dehalococcoidales bacterium]|nr:cyclase family protein [Dehalococcoidales bacterium]
MKTIDLTMPLFEGMGMGGCYPQESPFTVDRIVPGQGLARYGMCSEPGTRFCLPGFVGTDAETYLENFDIAKNINVEAVIVKLPLKMGETATVKQVEDAFARADFRNGDTAILYTGWGDVKRLEEMGDDYQWKSPNFGADDTCAKLTEILKAKNCPILGYDTASMSDYAELKPAWESLGRPKTWLREERDWSPEAKKYMLEQAEKRKAAPPPPPEGRGIMRIFRAGISFMGGLVNISSISKERVKLIILPLKIRGEYFSPARVVAIED